MKEQYNQNIVKSITFTIYGEPYNGETNLAQNYMKNFIKQIQLLDIHQFIENVALHCNIYHSSFPENIDEILIIDCLQKSGILKNKNQIKEKHIYHLIDKKTPCVVVKLEILLTI